MHVKTYRARSLQEALQLVRHELGSKAAVLHTREVTSARWLRWLGRPRWIEVTASASVHVPSRLAPRNNHTDLARGTAAASAAGIDLQQAEQFVSAQEVRSQLADLQSLVEGLCRRTAGSARHELSDVLFRQFTELLDADVPEELARELIDRLRVEATPLELADPHLLRSRLGVMLEAQIATAAPIELTPGRRHLVALVGPTGVGKTTTIAKLAANYRLQQRKRVGLITVDTYRIAAVEQLRTYADIIDLPMEVVATGQEMREALARLADLDLVLMDTAGRSPKDELRIAELSALLGEARPDEVHLVLSGTSSAASLTQAASRFAAAGTTALVLTKLDEAASLGNLLPLVRASQLPLSYVTHGQKVPDDIEAADPRKLARQVLGS